MLVCDYANGKAAHAHNPIIVALRDICYSCCVVCFVCCHDCLMPIKEQKRCTSNSHLGTFDEIIGFVAHRKRVFILHGSLKPINLFQLCIVCIFMHTKPYVLSYLGVFCIVLATLGNRHPCSRNHYWNLATENFSPVILSLCIELMSYYPVLMVRIHAI